MAGMLYYPFANAPVPVLQQAILYWDDLATVVAPGWEARLTDRMKAVQDAGLYRPLEADQAFDPFELHKIQGELGRALKQVPHDELIPPTQPPNGEFSTLHVGKLHKSVVNELQRQKLVYPHPDSSSRLVAAPALLNIVVSLIAERIAADNNARSGCAGPHGLRPHTDIRTAHRFNAEPTPGHDVTACWKVDLGPLLPVPREDVMISDLVHFRTKYDAERRRLMLAVDELLHQLKQAGRHPQDAYRLVERELADATTELKAAARSTRWNWFTRPVAAFVAVAAGSGALAHPNLGAPLTALSGAAINIATTQLRRSVSGAAQNYLYLHRTQNLVGGAA
ncbi:hypothetical protein [Micromonospora tulbaghiae]|uniref:hypothetical protein n=1 Tax=Micromonospora tulbaghiae TaxID=479978 RepID=UPI003EBDDDA0